MFRSATGGLGSPGGVKEGSVFLCIFFPYSITYRTATVASESLTSVIYDSWSSVLHRFEHELVHGGRRRSGFSTVVSRTVVITRTTDQRLIRETGRRLLFGNLSLSRCYVICVRILDVH